MNIVHLGSFGQPQESPVSGLSDALAKGFAIGEQRRSTQLEQAKLDAAEKQNAFDNAQKLRQLAQKDAEDKLAEEKQHLEMSSKMVDQVSAKAFSMDPDYVNGLTDKPNTMLAVFEQSDQYKELAKVAKKYGVEGAVNDNGTINYKSSKELNETRMDAFKTSYIQKKRSGQPTTPDEDIGYEFASVDPGLRAQIGALVSKDLRFRQAQIAGDDKTMGDIVASYITMFKRTGNTFSGALGQSTGVNPADRLEILNKKDTTS